MFLQFRSAANSTQAAPIANAARRATTVIQTMRTAAKRVRVPKLIGILHAVARCSIVVCSVFVDRATRVLCAIDAQPVTSVSPTGWPADARRVDAMQMAQRLEAMAVMNAMS